MDITKTPIAAKASHSTPLELEAGAARGMLGVAGVANVSGNTGEPLANSGPPPDAEPFDVLE
ncbi:MAG: hypothetical protein ACYDHF_07995 [Candidatus Cryosericum sp.]